MSVAIGFDIDGTITNDNAPGNIWDQEIERYFGVKRRNNSYDFSSAFGIDDDDIESFYRDRVPSIYSDVPIKEACSEITQSLSKAGIRIFLITARDPVHSEITHIYMEKHRVFYSDIIFTNDKVRACLDKDVRFFADDKAETCLSIAKIGIPCVMVNAFHNLHISYEPRVDDWITIGHHVIQAIRMELPSQTLKSILHSVSTVI